MSGLIKHLFIYSEHPSYKQIQKSTDCLKIPKQKCKFTYESESNRSWSLILWINLNQLKLECLYVYTYKKGEMNTEDHILASHKLAKCKKLPTTCWLNKIKEITDKVTLKWL